MYFLFAVGLIVIVGILFIIIKTRKINSYKVTLYKCSCCGLDFTENIKYCPLCLKKGEKVKLLSRTMRVI